MPSNPTEGEINEHHDLPDQILSVHRELASYFLDSVATTEVDARHDGAFGLVFYIIHLTYLVVHAYIGQTIQGRLTLRTAVEALIILKFLTKKDDRTIWLQYRNYGNGQAKLALLKYNEADRPDFVTKQQLEDLANADLWMEYQDIKLGAWADKNLRKMADEGDAKDLYDKYYDTLSGYLHANWSGVVHASFSVCMNPLHRFHRIPRPPQLFPDDAALDMVRIANHALDVLAMLYPPFKPRIRTKDAESLPEEGAGGDT